MIRRTVRVFARVLLCLAAGCTPHLGVTVTNAPTLPDCIPGSARKPCP